MASGTVSTRPPAESAPTLGRYEEFIQKRLEHTRRQVRLVDVASGVVVLLAASLFFFLAVALADHWLFPHGLNFFARLILWGIWVAVAGLFAWRTVAPAVMHRINPVFAAQTIEQGRPTLKNSLINFLLLRSHPDDVAPVVFRAMEHRAAADLARVPVEHAVDHRRLVRLCYVLAGAVVLFALYLALSPKNPLVSAARVLWPWAGIPAPTRVHIEDVHVRTVDVQPGDAVVFQGDRPQVAAHVSGLRDGEEVSLLMTTADGQEVDDRVAMNRTGDDDFYACELPPGSGTMQQDTFYRITAGDATTKQYKLEVQIAPTIIVDRIEYHYPPYTGWPDRTVKGQGDIKGLEGTRVTVHVTANIEIKNACIDLGCSGLLVPMKHDGTKATGEFTLASEKGQSWKPLYDRYQILLTDSKGSNEPHQHPIHYRIDVDRDYPPEIAIVEPKQEEAAVNVNGHLRIRVHTADDFGLRHVAFKAEHDGHSLDLPVVFDRPRPEKALAQPFDGELDFQPAKLQLKRGDEIKYWAEAEDNKEPKPNRAETPQRTIRVVDDQDAKDGQANQDQQPNGTNQTGESRPQPGNNGPGKGEAASKDAGKPSEGGTSTGKNDGGQGAASKSQKPEPGDKTDPNKSDKDSGEKKTAPSQPKDGAKGERSDFESSDQGQKPLDPTTQTADATEEILKHLQDQEKEEQQKKEQQQDQARPSGEGSQPNSQQQTEQPSASGGSSQSAGNPPNGGQSSAPQGGKQESRQPQNGSTDKNDRGGGAGSTSSGKNNSANNSAAGQQPKSGTEGSANKGPKQASPPQGSDVAQPNAGQSPQNAGSKGDNPPKPSDGADNHSANSSEGNKAESKPGGKQGPDKQPSGGTKSPDQKQAGSPQNKDGQSGGAAKNAEKKQAGSQGTEKDNQLAMNGTKPQPKPSSPDGNSRTENSNATPKQDKSTKPQGNNSAAGDGQSSPNKPEEKGKAAGASSGGEPKSKSDNGEQPKSGSGGKQSPDGAKNQKPGNMANSQPQQMDPGKTGEPTTQSSGAAPDPQGEQKQGEPKPGDAREGLDPKSNNPRSPSTSQHDSDSKSETRGANSGGGGAGGGQQDKKAGRGAAGTEKPADEGGLTSNEKGRGANGKKTGETARTTDKMDSPKKESGEGSGENPKPSEQSATNDSQKPQGNSTENASDKQAKSNGGRSGATSPQQSGRQGTGLPSGGSQPGGQAEPPPSEHEDSKPDAADPTFAKKQVDLALRHLKDEMSKPKSDLLDHLGWTPEEAKKFVENIEKLRDAANQSGSEANKNAYPEFLKDLGLRPHGTRIAGGATRTDNLRGVRDAGQMQPPAEWDEITRQYSRSTAEGK